MLHGTLEGISDSDYGGVKIKRSQILGDGWDYIALGHYHLRTKIADNAYYSGSTEYTSNNPWEEVGKDQPKKGFIEFDTATREMTFHEVKARAFVDLPPIQGNSLSAPEIMQKIEEATAKVKGGIAEKVVRLVAWDVPRKVQIDLDHARLRELRASALHYDLSLRVPKAKGSVAFTSTGAVIRRSLEQEWTEYADEASLPSGVERDPFKGLGLDYLARVSSETVPADGAEDARHG
jgi:DNA repair exonuclease SbcCD nuclease subunit